MSSYVERTLAAFERLEEENEKLIVKLNAEHIVRQNAEAENAKLREQGARLFDKTLELGTENEKLRELVRKWYPHMLKRVGRDALEQWGQMEVVKELGIEVIDG